MYEVGHPLTTPDPYTNMVKEDLKVSQAHAENEVRTFFSPLLFPRKNDIQQREGRATKQVNNSQNNTTIMEQTQLTPEQQKRVEGYEKSLTFHGFNPEYHKPGIEKAVRENKPTFELNDQARDAKDVRYYLNFSTNSNDNPKFTYKAENLANGAKMSFPQFGLMPSKDATEGILTMGFAKVQMAKKDGEKYHCILGLDAKNLPKTWEQAKELFDPKASHVKTYAISYAPIPAVHFGHEFTPKDMAILLKGKPITVETVDFKTGEKLEVSGLKLDFPTDQNGKERFQLTYDQKKGTGVFLSADELLTLKDSIKPKKEGIEGDRLSQTEALAAPLVEEQATAGDDDSEDEDKPKQKKSRGKSIKA